MARYERTYAGERRTETSVCQLTPSERAELDAAAALQGARLSDYARELLFRRSAASSPAPAAIRKPPRSCAALDAAAYRTSHRQQPQPDCPAV